MTQHPPAPMNYPGQWNPTQPAYGQHQPFVGQKSFLATWLLSWLLGGLGADRFYLGKIGTGILKLITLGGLGLWSLIALIITLVGAQKDKHGLPLQGYDQHQLIAWIVTGTFFLLGLTLGGLGLWSLLYLISTRVGAQTDKHALPLQVYGQPKKIAWIVTGIFLVLGLIICGVPANSPPTPQTDASSIVSEAEEADVEAP